MVHDRQGLAIQIPATPRIGRWFVPRGKGWWGAVPIAEGSACSQSAPGATLDSIPQASYCDKHASDRGSIMSRRLLRLTGTVLLIATALVRPTVVVTAAPSSADTLVDGCTIVSNPPPLHFTNCPNAQLGGADLAGVNLSYAKLEGAAFVDCEVESATAACSAANLTDVDLTGADLVGAVFFTLGQFLPPSPVGVEASGANFFGADLS